MSAYGFILIVSCAAMYQLGAYNERHPGKLWRQAAALGWQWLRKWRH